MEIPRGYAKPGETSRQCAARELREETGYGVDESRLYKLGVTHPNTALIRGGVTLYLARLEHTTLHTSADAEGRVTAWMPLAQLGEWLAGGRLTDGFTLSALAFYLGREQC